MECEGDAATANRAEGELTFRADVPYVGAIACGETDRAQHQWRGLEEKLAESIQRFDRLDEKDVEGLQRILAQAGEQREADDERSGCGEQWRRPAHEARRLRPGFQLNLHLRSLQSSRRWPIR